MISKEVVQKLVDQWLADKDYFLCDLTITADDRILVEIDHEEGVWIEDCVALSRFIEEGLDRDEADFELEVGSAGIGQPFKVRRQYDIHVGDQVEVLTAAGRKLTGVLSKVGDDAFVLTTTEKVKVPGEKRPRQKEVAHMLPFVDVKWTKLYIDFK